MDDNKPIYTLSQLSNQVVITDQDEPRMSSLDFLKEFINPLRVEHGEPKLRNSEFVRQIADELEIPIADFLQLTPERGGVPQKYLMLDFEEMLLVGMRISKASRKRVKQELKALKIKVAELEGPKVEDPIVQLAHKVIEQDKEIKSLAGEVQHLSGELSAIMPKAKFLALISGCGETLTFRQVTKLLKANENDFREFLLEEKILYRLNRNLHPHAKHVDAGRCVVNCGIANNGHNYAQTYFTPKGVEYVGTLWLDHLNNTALGEFDLAESIDE